MSRLAAGLAADWWWTERFTTALLQEKLRSAIFGWTRAALFSSSAVPAGRWMPGSGNSRSRVNAAFYGSSLAGQAAERPNTLPWRWRKATPWRGKFLKKRPRISPSDCRMLFIYFTRKSLSLVEGFPSSESHCEQPSRKLCRLSRWKRLRQVQRSGSRAWERTQFRWVL